MLKIDRSIRTKTWYVSCPFCFNILTFEMSSPVYCHRCNEELPNYSKLMDDIDERKVYYLLGDLWEGAA